MRKTIAPFVFTLATGQSLHAQLLRNATCYPNPECTEFTHYMLSNVSEGHEYIYDASAFPVDFKRPIAVTSLAGIGETSDTNWANFHPWVNVFTSPLAFQESALVGDVLSLTNVPLAGEPIAIGSDPRHYVVLDIEPFIIPAGEHWISIVVARYDANWAWTETSVSLGHDIGKAYDVVQYYTYNFGSWTTGSLAIDVGGHLLCDADVVPPGIGNGVINLDDLLFVIDQWAATGDNPADITGNGVVDVEDLLAVINEWGTCE